MLWNVPQLLFASVFWAAQVFQTRGFPSYLTLQRRSGQKGAWRFSVLSLPWHSEPDRARFRALGTACGLKFPISPKLRSKILYTDFSELGPNSPDFKIATARECRWQWCGDSHCNRGLDHVSDKLTQRMGGSSKFINKLKAYRWRIHFQRPEYQPYLFSDLISKVVWQLHTNWETPPVSQHWRRSPWSPQWREKNKVCLEDSKLCWAV